MKYKHQSIINQLKRKVLLTFSLKSVLYCVVRSTSSLPLGGGSITMNQMIAHALATRESLKASIDLRRVLGKRVFADGVRGAMPTPVVVLLFRLQRANLQAHRLNLRALTSAGRQQYWQIVRRRTSTC